MTSDSRDVLEWDRERWVEAQQELLSLAEARKWVEVMAQARVCAQWAYKKSFPDPHWNEFSLHMGSSRGDLIHVSTWALASAVTGGMRKVKPVRLEDLRAFTRGVRHYRASDERWNFSGLKRLPEADVGFFVAWALDAYEGLRKEWPRDSMAGIFDDMAFLQEHEQHDAAERLGREAKVIIPLWTDLSDLLRNILEVLGDQGAGLDRNDIAQRLGLNRAGKKRVGHDIGRELTDLVRMGILKNMQGVGYEVRTWPEGTPEDVRKAR